MSNGDFSSFTDPRMTASEIDRMPSASRRSGRILFILAFSLAVVLAAGAHSGTLQAAWDALTGNQIEVGGAPVPATHAKFSEHEREYILGCKPQEQAERLLQAAVNHDQGATELIQELVDGWRGKIKDSQQLQTLLLTALYSNDLRVRAAAIEVSLAAHNFAKTEESVSALRQMGEMNVKSRPYAAWYLGMLANRGVETEAVYELLKNWAHDSDEQTRFWSVEGLAHLGTDKTIEDFVDVLGHDPSLDVRERAGCSLAKSGMLTREQRMKAVPGLLQLADDESLNSTARTWVYQALREITDVNLPNDPAQWHNWYDQHGAEQAKKFQADGDSVLGNN
jgi:hypothetical protein